MLGAEARAHHCLGSPVVPGPLAGWHLAPFLSRMPSSFLLNVCKL